MAQHRRTRRAHAWRVLLALATVTTFALFVVTPALPLEGEGARGPEVPEEPSAVNNTTGAPTMSVSPTRVPGGSS